jgi:hypothetical protein
MIEHWILRGLFRFRRVLFFAALFADFVAGLCREQGAAPYFVSYAGLTRVFIAFETTLARQMDCRVIARQ